MTTQADWRIESPQATLAANLLIARHVGELTQHQLADAARISRGTIAQLETGCGDPRLSTISDLAAAVGIPPFLLLIGLREARVLVHLISSAPKSSNQLPTPLVHAMQERVASGFIKDRLRAAALGASTVSDQGQGAVSISAAIFSSLLPGAGTLVGAELGKLIAAQQPAICSSI